MREIPLASSTLCAIVDDEDYSALSRFPWYKSNQGYARRTDCDASTGRPRRSLSMHRVILGAPPGIDVDHANGNKLDNRRSNIRLCRRALNNANVPARRGCASQFKGVGREVGGHKWVAQIAAKGVRYYLGVFADERDAAKAYDAAARFHHGEFAWTNFGQEETPA